MLSSTGKLGRTLSEILRTSGNRVALRYGDIDLTYEGLEARAVDQGLTISSGIGSGKRVALRFDATLRHVEAYLAIVHSENIPFLIDPSTSVEMMRGLCSTAGIEYELTPVAGGKTSGLITPTGASLMGRSALQTDTAVCRFTSGTTTLPRCLEYSADAVVRAASTWSSASGLAKDDVVLCVAPYSNGLAFNTSLAAVWLASATLAVRPAALMTSRAFVETLINEDVTRVVAFPSFYRRILGTDVPKTFNKLRLLVSAASRLPLDEKTQLQSKFGVPVIDYYGVAEVGPVTDGRDPDLKGSLGYPLPHVEVRIDRHGRRSGEILVRTPYRATSYLNDFGEFRKKLDGDFIRTGDVGELRDGALFVTGRTDRIVKIGGRALDPALIESACLEYKGITDAVAFSTISRSGETVLHLVVAPSADVPMLRSHLRSRLGPNFVPAHISIRDQIPRNAAGKPIPSLLPEINHAR